MSSALLIALACWALGSTTLPRLVRGANFLPASLFTTSAFATGFVMFSLLAQTLSFCGMGLRFSTLLIVACGLVIAVLKLREHPTLLKALPSPKPNDGWRRHSAALVFLFLTITYFLGLIINNIFRPIFPWDAFTTWMYRGKAWALQDHIEPITNTLDWLNSDGVSGVAIYADFYPETVSLIAAMASAVSTGWDPSAASILWSVAWLMLAFGVFGLCRAIDVSERLAFFSASLVALAPLVVMHAALAGYADLWVALFSGLGLASLLSGRLQSQRSLIHLGFVLLALGTQIKTEAWIWLGIGATYIVLEVCRQKLGVRALASAILVLLTAILLTGTRGVDLGWAGKWGIVENLLHAGPLGTFLLRPYNPAPDYFETLFITNNFGLLPILYLVGLGALFLTRSQQAVSHLTLFSLIVATQAVIFGVSDYSQFAASGTAITRLIIHFLPVFALTTAAGLTTLLASMLGRSGQPTSVFGAKRAIPVASHGLVAVYLGLAFAFLLGVSHMTSKHAATEFNPQDLIALFGTAELDEHERWKFTRSPQDFGVLAGNMALPENARYVVARVYGRQATDVAFYWSTGPNGDLHRIFVPNEGTSLMDLSENPSWVPEKVRELGYVVRKRSFEDTAVGGIAISTHLERKAIPGILNRWLAEPPITQRTLNNLSRADSGPTLLEWLSLAVIIAIIFASLLNLFLKSPSETGRVSLLSMLFTAVLATQLVFLQGFIRTTWTLISPPTTVMRDNQDAEDVLQNLANLARSELPADEPIAVIATDPRADFYAQKIPFMLLPLRAIFVQNHYSDLPAQWSGSVLLVGEEQAKLTTVTQELSRKLDRSLETVFTSGNVRVVR